MKNRYTYKLINNKITGYKNDIKLKNKYSKAILEYIISMIDSDKYSNDNMNISVNSQDLLISIENDEVLIRGYRKVFNRLNRGDINNYISGNIVTKKRVVEIGLSILAAILIGTVINGYSKNSKSSSKENGNIAITWEKIPEDEKIDNSNIDNQDINIDNGENLGSNKDEESGILTNDINNDIIYFNPYDSLNDTESINNTLKYSEYINEVSIKWGISRDLLISMIAQESNGDASNNKLMGFEFNAFKDTELKVFNYIDNKYEIVAFSNNINKFKDADIVITQDNLEHPKTQIAAGAIVLNYLNNKYDNNTMLAVMAYNAGVTNTDKILQATSYEIGIPVYDIIQDQNKTDYEDYTDAVLKSNYGDQEYIKHVAGRAKDNSIFDTNPNDNNEIIIKHSK